jgi:hypothetical protein
VRDFCAIFSIGALAADAIRRWWHRLGRWHYPADSPLLLLADCSGSNGYRVPVSREQQTSGRGFKPCPPNISNHSVSLR